MVFGVHSKKRSPLFLFGIIINYYLFEKMIIFIIIKKQVILGEKIVCKYLKLACLF